MQNISRSAALLREVATYMPGGTPGMYYPPVPYARVMARGAGSRIWDVDGSEYIDCICGSGALLLGHAHPAVTAAARRQLELGSTFFALSEPLVQLAAELVAAIPCAEAIRFCTTGGEATLYAMRMARAFTGRSKILKFEGGFHGAHDWAVQSLTPAAPVPYPTAVPDSGGIPESVTGDVLVAPFNDLQTTAAIVERHRHELAAIIVEPLQRVISPLPGFLAGLRQIANDNGVLLIFDEIVTGFRLAWGGAQEYYGVVPDLAAYGKAISCGYPLAAVAGRRDIMATSDPQRSGQPDFAWVSGTFGAFPMGAAAGLAALTELRKDGVYPRLHAVGQRLRTGIEDLGRQYGFQVKALGDSTLCTVYFLDRDEVVQYRDLLGADTELAVRLGQELLNQGLHVYPGSKFYLSAVHSDDDLDQILRAYDQGFAALAKSH